METSAPKRRKTSPTSSVRLTNSSASAHSSSSGVTRRSSRGRRPSFASPTKASLARANPDILERRNAQLTKKHAGALAGDRPDSAETAQDQVQAVTAQLEGASENRPTSDPVQPSAGAGPAIADPHSPSRRLVSGMRAKPRRSINKPSPRPLPPPSVHEEELLDPFKGTVLRRSLDHGVLPLREPEEPDEPQLPPTPTEKGISDPHAINTSPMGIHNTPSRRPRRSRALADKLRSGSSPLKQPPMRPIDLGYTGKAISQTLGDSRSTPTTARKTSLQATAGNSRAVSSGRTRNAPKERQLSIDTDKPHPGRGVGEIEPFADKKAARDALLVEVAQLEADLRVVRTGNVNLHRSRWRDQTSTALLGPDDRLALLDALSRHALPPEEESSPDPTQVWLEAAFDPSTFLPFGCSATTLPNPLQATDAEEAQAPPASHHPIPMTIDEELGYLQLFTPLTFESTTTIVPIDRDVEVGDEDVEPLMQQHDISVFSNPRGTFSARIEMLVNTQTLAVAELSVPKLEPASLNELGPFVKSIVESETGTISALKRNVSILTWAMAEWTRLANRRARFWCLVTQELGHWQGIMDCAKKKRMPRKGRRVPRQPPGSEEDSSENEDESTKQGQTSKSQLLAFLGRSSFDLDLSPGGMEEVELRISWNIEFDWTGEGKSTIGVLVQAPGKCEFVSTLSLFYSPTDPSRVCP